MSKDKQSWPVVLRMNEQDVEMDRTVAATLEELPELMRRKETKGWKLTGVCWPPGQWFGGNVVSLFWTRPVRKPRPPSGE